MIRHIVMFTAKDPASMQAIFDGLMVLKDIPHVRHFEVGKNSHVDTLTAKAPDFVVYAEFESQADLDAYKAHPLYQKSIEIVRPLRDTRIAADFDAES